MFTACGASIAQRDCGKDCRRVYQTVYGAQRLDLKTVNQFNIIINVLYKDFIIYSLCLIFSNSIHLHGSLAAHTHFHHHNLLLKNLSIKKKN